VAGGAQAVGLTPEVVLSLSSEEVTRLRAANATALDSGQLPRAAVAAWRRVGLELNSSTHAHLLLRPPAPRRDVRVRVLDAVERVSSERNLCIIFEELRAGANDGVASSAQLREAGFYHLRVAESGQFSESARVHGRIFKRECSLPTASSEHQVELDGVIVASVDADGGGARLHIHPFLGAHGKLTTAGLLWRSDTFAAIIDAVLAASPLRTDANVLPNDSERERELREAVATLDLLPGFVRAVGVNPEPQRREIATQIAAGSSTITHLRTQLMDAVRAQTTLEASALALERSANALSIENISNALVQVNHIRTRLRPVREVALAGGGGQPAITVTLHPLVMRHRSQRYLMDQLAFTIPLTGGHMQPHWLKIMAGNGSPHPHVSSTGNTCWGAAQVPLQQALERKDFAGAVMIIVGWASKYNASSPYTTLGAGCPFEICALAPGWHPELPVREP
jgi:hypothetical protein